MSTTEEPARVRLRVRGQVQGVGFRPFVWRLANELELAGWVRNDGEGVEVDAQGARAAVEALIARLPREAPGLARITAFESAPAAPEARAAGFTIAHSGSGRATVQVAPEVATCPECLAELFDPADRRWRYPFINCTQCGPRYTIIRALPYDRPQTSMAAFAQCSQCQGEYDDPATRRFHAQPNACAACGPGLELLDRNGVRIACDDAIGETVARLARGDILAIKGLGGFHLVCDARNAQAVAALRQRKHREEKPFAVMVANCASAAAFAHTDDAERVALQSTASPIVLLRKHPGCDEALAGVAPGLAWLGVMLPYTPLQWLLFHEAAGRPAGTQWMRAAQPLALVMTSANPGGEPLVIANDEALRRLSDIADAFLMHDRDIVTRCDDSVVRIEDSGSRIEDRGSSGAGGILTPSHSALAPASSILDPVFQFIRRARGYTPQAIRMARAGPPVLACGAFLKNTVCLTRGAEAFVSQHIGDLDNGPTCSALEETVERLSRLLEIEPRVVAHDLHPDFFSTRFAVEYAQARGLQAVAVQHHHAHVAAVMAEHGLEGEVLGLALDGVGLGTDGGVWGGELLRASPAEFERIGHLAHLRLPGGDRAAREPWRMAAAALHAIGRADEIAARFALPGAPTVRCMLDDGINSPPTSSAGRWFDAAAGLARIKDCAAFEGQAAMVYEGLAEAHGACAPLPGTWRVGDDGTLDAKPLLARLADEPDAARAAALFHASFAAALADWVQWAAERSGLKRVALGGGCFLNSVLSRTLRGRLETMGFDVFEARLVPPNDGGVSLGQAYVALHVAAREN